MSGPETCVRFRGHGARVMIEDKEIEHYAIHVDPAKKEVSCWIASEANKVREYLVFRHRHLVQHYATYLGVFGRMVRKRC
jgi:hypothetical protein